MQTTKNKNSKLYQKPPFLYVTCHTYHLPVPLAPETNWFEILYQKAEIKYLTVKEIERALKESAVDCYLNESANKDKENKYTCDK